MQAKALKDGGPGNSVRRRGARRGLLWAGALWIFAAAAAASPPVIEMEPSCEHRKLGTVSIEAGTRIAENSLDPNPTPVNYPRAFARLADAAAEQGANAVILRKHRATYYTRAGRRTPEAVHLRLSGAAIRLDDPQSCALDVSDPRAYAESGRTRRIVDTTSDRAYGGE